MTAILTAISLILAVRLLLLLSIIGGTVLCWEAILTPDLLKIGVCLVYCAGVVMPLVYLALRGNANVQSTEA